MGNIISNIISDPDDPCQEDIFNCVRDEYIYILDRYKKKLNGYKDIYSNNCLHHAISQKCPNLKVIEFLLNNGVDVNHKNKNGETPLEIAIQKQKQSIIELLINTKYNKQNIKKIEELTIYNNSLQIENDNLGKRKRDNEQIITKLQDENKILKEKNDESERIKKNLESKYKKKK
jgi:ankyrin repeat protein